MSVQLVNPYCSNAQVRSYIRNQDASIDDQINFAINAASRWIDEYKGRDYFEHDYSAAPGLLIDDWMERATGNTLWLPYAPVVQWIQLQVGQNIWTPETTATILAGDMAEVDYRIRFDTAELISFRGTWLPDRKFLPGII